MPQNFENGLTIDALVDPRDYVCAKTQTESDRIKQQTTAKMFKTDDPSYFRIQVANGQLADPLATVTLKIGIGEHTVVEHSVLMKVLTKPVIVLHFPRDNSVVNDALQNLITLITWQCKS